MHRLLFFLGSVEVEVVAELDLVGLNWGEKDWDRLGKKDWDRPIFFLEFDDHISPFNCKDGP